MNPLALGPRLFAAWLLIRVADHVSGLARKLAYAETRRRGDPDAPMSGRGLIIIALTIASWALLAAVSCGAVKLIGGGI